MDTADDMVGEEGAGIRVFLVEDHAYLRGMVASYLSDVAGLTICGTASSGTEALERLAECACDLALVDVSMPGMSGIELVGHLREQCPEVRCLMLSGHLGEGYVAESLAAGARGYVEKGDPAVLVVAIAEVLRGERYVSERFRHLLTAS